jgi:hypothetical protein
MTRTISLITAVAGLALVLAAPALANHQQGDAVAQHQDFWNYDQQGQKITNTSPGLGAEDLASLYSTGASSQSSQAMKADKLRSEALNRKHGLGDQSVAAGQRLVFDNHRSGNANGGQLSVIVPDVVDRAVAARETTGRGIGFDNYKIEPPSTVVVTGSTTSSGRELEWPQLGIGFAIGLMLALGLGLALRALHVRPLAH